MHNLYNIWKEQYQEVKNLLRYLGTYPEVLVKTGIDKLVPITELDASQNDWVRLYSKLDNPLEKDFFKPFWVLIKNGSLDIFIDMSDPKYPIFEANYFWLEPYRWYKKFLVKDIRELLLAHDENIDLESIFKANDDERWKEVKQFHAHRKRLGFEGKIYVKKVTLDEIPANHPKNIIVTISDAESILEVSGVSALIAGLLPGEFRVALNNLIFYDGERVSNYLDVKNIRDFVFLLRDSGCLRVRNYLIGIPDVEGYIAYHEHTVKIKCTDSLLLSSVTYQLISLI